MIVWMAKICVLDVCRSPSTKYTQEMKGRNSRQVTYSTLDVALGKSALGSYPSHIGSMCRGTENKACPLSARGPYTSLACTAGLGERSFCLGEGKEQVRCGGVSGDVHSVLLEGCAGSEEPPFECVEAGDGEERRWEGRRC